MLNSVHVKNFRLFKEFHLDDLARVNLIVGKNNVGKSSLLEAVSLLVNQQAPSILFEMAKNRQEVVYKEGVRGYELADLFYNRQIKSQRDMEVSITGRPDLSTRIFYRGRDNGRAAREPFLSVVYKTGEETPSSSAIRLMPGFLADDDERKRQIVESNEINTRIITAEKPGYEQMVQIWDKGLLTSLEEDAAEMMRIIVPDLQRIANQVTNKRFIVKQKDRSPVALGSLGEGAAHILGIALSLSHANNGFLLVDEIDTGLHYRVLTDVWRAVMETAVRLNVQVFATTHSYDCIRSFAEALGLMEDDNIGVLYRLQERTGKIEARRIDAENIIYAIVQDIEVR